MNLSNIKLPIGIIAVIVAQAFGIIWYVAQLDSTVTNLDVSVTEIKEQATTVDVAVLQTDVENLKEKITMMDEMHSEKFDSTPLDEAIAELEEVLAELEDRIVDLETIDAIIDNEMRTIMSDHSNFNDVLKDMGKSGYGDNRQYGSYSD